MTTLHRVLTRKSLLSVAAPSAWKLVVVFHTAEYLKAVLVNAFSSPRFASVVVSGTFGNMCLIAGCIVGLFFEHQEWRSGNNQQARVASDRANNKPAVSLLLPPDNRFSFQDVIPGADTFTVHEEIRTKDTLTKRRIEISRREALLHLPFLNASSQPPSQVTGPPPLRSRSRGHPARGRSRKRRRG